MRLKPGQTHLSTLTDREIQALASTFCAIPQNLSRLGFRWMRSGDREAVTRAFKKIELERADRRRKAIYRTGFRARRKSRPWPVEFEGHELGSMEMITWNEGWKAGVT